MSLANDIIGLINVGSSNAAAWYGAINNKPIITPAMSSAQIAAQQAQIEAQNRANLGANNPIIAGVLSPTTLIILVVGVALTVYLTRKK